jgi:hypothetical protein
MKEDENVERVAWPGSACKVRIIGATIFALGALSIVSVAATGNGAAWLSTFVDRTTRAPIQVDSVNATNANGRPRISAIVRRLVWKMGVRRFVPDQSATEY